jgi:hypothetical protein
MAPMALPYTYCSPKITAERSEPPAATISIPPSISVYKTEPPFSTTCEPP